MNDEKSNKVDLAKVVAKMHSYKHLQNLPESHQAMIVSTDRYPSQSPPPPPPPPPPASSLSVQEWVDKDSNHLSVASQALPYTTPVLHSEEAYSHGHPSYPAGPNANLLAYKPSAEMHSTNEPFVSSIIVDLESLLCRKPYIYQMHRSGFSPESIQRAFKKLHDVDISSEMINSVIAEYGSVASPKTQPRLVSTNPLVAHAHSRSSSVTSIQGIKNEIPLQEPKPRGSLLQVTPATNIFIPLDDLSADQALKALESLQSLVAEKIELLRLKIREEQAEQERRRKEEEDEIVRNHIAEIQRKLDELDRMKRGDALDLLNREIEHKRLG